MSAYITGARGAANSSVTIILGFESTQGFIFADLSKKSWS